MIKVSIVCSGDVTRSDLAARHEVVPVQTRSFDDRGRWFIRGPFGRPTSNGRIHQLTCQECGFAERIAEADLDQMFRAAKTRGMEVVELRHVRRILRTID